MSPRFEINSLEYWQVISTYLPRGKMTLPVRGTRYQETEGRYSNIQSNLGIRKRERVRAQYLRRKREESSCKACNNRRKSKSGANGRRS